MKKSLTPEKFMSSLSYDIRLAPYDIQGSIAHARMLAKCGIISPEDEKKIITGLQEILKDIKKGFTLPFEEDIHMAVEKELIKRIGAAGGRLHTARSRNDQVVLDTLLYVKDCIAQQIKLIAGVQKSLLVQAKKHIGTVMPGMTHLQHAQPVLLAQHLLAYDWMFQRDKERLTDALVRMDSCPLGSAALAGTSFSIDRAYTAKLLGFSKPSENSIDSVSSRDFIAEFLSADALIMAHISRLAEDLIIWSSQEFGFVQLSDAFSSGSSIMPQKKNPDFAEIIRSKTGRVYGSLFGFLTMIKGLPLAYNRDLQEDKPLLFDTADTVHGVLELAGQMIASLVFDKKRMLFACRDGFLEATELADYLVQKKLPFRKAHAVVREIVASCITNQKRLKDMTLAELKKYSRLFDEQSLKVLDNEAIVQRKRSSGGTAQSQVTVQIQKLDKLIRR